MKTLLIVFCIGLVACQADAQKINEKDVPANIKNVLTKSFGVTSAKWDKEDSNFEANFKAKGKETSVVFDASGAILETEVEIKKSELPASIMETLKKDYADAKIEEVAKIDAKGVTTYEVEVEIGEDTFDLIFDTDGNLIKKEKKEDEDEEEG